MSKKPTWVEMLETSIQELKSEYDVRFKKLEHRLTENVAIIQLDLTVAIYGLALAKNKETFKMFLSALKKFLDEWKETGIMIFKERKRLNDAIIFARMFGIENFEDLIKKLVSKFGIKLIKESVTIEQVTESYGVKGAKIFRSL